MCPLAISDAQRIAVQFFNLSLLTSDFMSALARFLFFDGFTLRAALFFAGSCALVVTGLVLYYTAPATAEHHKDFDMVAGGGSESRPLGGSGEAHGAESLSVRAARVRAHSVLDAGRSCELRDDISTPTAADCKQGALAAAVLPDAEDTCVHCHTDSQTQLHSGSSSALAAEASSAAGPQCAQRAFVSGGAVHLEPG